MSCGVPNILIKTTLKYYCIQYAIARSLGLDTAKAMEGRCVREITNKKNH